MVEGDKKLTRLRIEGEALIYDTYIISHVAGILRIDCSKFTDHAAVSVVDSQVLWPQYLFTASEGDDRRVFRSP